MRWLSISATDVKEWFQYQCERKLVFRSLRSDGEGTETGVPQLAVDRETGSWSVFGNDYERDVVGSLAPHVVLPKRGAPKLDAAESTAFLAAPGLPFAHQLRLEVDIEAGDLSWFLRRTPANVRLAPVYPDLVWSRTLVPGETGPVFEVIDVKASQEARMFHRVQVAWYAILLRAMLRRHSLPGTVSPTGQVWHLLPAGQQAEDGSRIQKRSFPLAPYERQVRSFLENVIPALDVGGSGFDVWETPAFHVYFKCEQCPYFDQVAEGERSCEDSVRAPGRDRLDISAVPGFSQSSKRLLLSRGLNTVGRLVRASQRDRRFCEEASWQLRRIWDRQNDRARAILSQAASIRDYERTFAMPAQVTDAIYLAADTDPIEGDLVTISCFIKSPAGAESPSIRVLQRSDPAGERQAIHEVFERVRLHLEAVHTHNIESPEDARYAHLFVYEASELRAIAEAFARHAASTPDFASAMAQLIRLIPPVSANREPEYAGVRHLPVTVVRQVVETIYALPAVVTLDLSRVTAALAEHPGELIPLTTPYVPKDVVLSRRPVGNVPVPRELSFAQKLSSQLSVDVLRGMRLLARSDHPENAALAGELSAQVERDIEDRLRALAALQSAIVAHHVARAERGFLLLKKEPFQLFADVAPFERNSLNVLRMQHRYEAQVNEIDTLSALAAPATRRVERGICIGPLAIRPQGEESQGRFSCWLEFQVDPRARESDLFRESSFNLILHNGNDLCLLVPERWGSHRIKGMKRAGHDRVRVRVDRQQREGVFANLDQGPWFLDEVVSSENSDALDAFLAHIGQAPS